MHVVGFCHKKIEEIANLFFEDRGKVWNAIGMEVVLLVCFVMGYWFFNSTLVRAWLCEVHGERPARLSAVGS